MVPIIFYCFFFISFCGVHGNFGKCFFFFFFIKKNEFFFESESKFFLKIYGKKDIKEFLRNIDEMNDY